MALRADWLPALAAFESAARHQNFAHAAEELHLTASAVSHHVRKLEARLGVASVPAPRARGVADRRRPPAGGRRRQCHGRHRRRAARPARRRDEQDRVRITTLHSLTYTWLLPRLPAFAALHPQVRLTVDTEVALTRFDEGGPTSASATARAIGRG